MKLTPIRLIRQNQKGSTIVNVLMISSVMAIGIGFLLNRISTQQKLSIDLRSEISTSLAIQSLTDYARYALKNKWCLGADFRPLAFPSGDGEDNYNCYRDYGKDPRSDNNLSRVILNTKYAKKIILLKRKYALAMGDVQLPNTVDCNESIDLALEESPAKIEACAQSMKKDSVTVTTTVAELNNVPDNVPKTPLARILSDSNLKRKDRPITSVSVTYTVMKEMSLPGTDDNTYVKIKTQLLDENNQPIANGQKLASEEEIVLAVPRELNYFSLITRGNIFIGKSVDGNNTDGNVYIPNMESADYKGISFYGPVYINRNLVLPDMPSNAANKKPYAAFYEPVVFGAGRITSVNASTGFTQAQASGVKKVWKDLGSFGGFAKGFETDAYNDAGLDSIAQAADPNSSNNDVITCINRLQEQEIPAITLDSKLYAKPRLPAVLFDGVTPTDYNHRRYIMGFWKKIQLPDGPPTRQKIYYPKVKTFTAGTAVGAAGNLGKAGGSSQIAASINGFNPASPDLSYALLADISWRYGSANLVKEDIPLPDEGTVEIKLNSTAPTTLGTIKISVKKYMIGSNSQPHLRDVQVEVSGSLADGTDHPINYIKFRGMDNTCNLLADGSCLEGQGSTGSNKDIYLKKWTNLANEPAGCTSTDIYGSRPTPTDYDNCTSGMVRTLPLNYELNLGYNYGADYERCRTLGTVNAGGANQSEVEADFVSRTYQGWEFKNKRDDNVDITFTASNGSIFTSSAIFHNCKVPASVNVVAGNFMCKNLIIDPRQTELFMVGTFVVINRFEIDPSAVRSGVSFYSVHSGAEILRQVQILKTSDGASCNSLQSENIPFWHPNPGMKAMSDRIKCSPISILNEGTPDKFPFRWTSVSADCVRYPSGSEPDTTCLKKIKNYFFKSMERHYVNRTQ